MFHAKILIGAALAALCAGSALADDMPGGALGKYAGYYQLTPVSDLRITVSGDHLTLLHNGHPLTDLAPQDDGTFTGTSMAVKINFVAAADGTIKSLVLESGSQPRPAQRIDEAAAAAIEKQANSAGVFRAGVSPGPLYAQSPMN